MTNYEIIGIRDSEYTDKKTKEKVKFRILYLGYEENGVTGIGCKDIFFPLARFPEIASFRLGDHIFIFYNERGFVQEVRKSG